MHHHAVHQNRQPIAELPTDFTDSTRRNHNAGRVVPGKLLVERCLTRRRPVDREGEGAIRHSSFLVW
jgi:hypothetical protein